MKVDALGRYIEGGGFGSLWTISAAGSSSPDHRLFTGLLQGGYDLEWRP